MIPEKIGRYIIENELGRGGMAVVYLATDPFMNREVAIKVLPRQFTFDPQFRFRFQREAQVIAKLDHPAIVPVYDFGEHDEQPFIVMRYMKGGSLADRLKEKGPIPVPEAAEILRRIGSALDEAHQKGIVHRDLKPGNILFDDRDDAFVGDFGIVKMSEATIQYTGNAIIGTPGYMSPEQARGDEEIDGRSDIYSLGAIAYEMLTGKLPYHSDTPMGLVMKHILEPVPNLLAERPDLSPGTATVISTAMAKLPDARFQTCTDIASALSEAATLQIPGSQQATIVEPPVQKQEMAGTVVESSAYVPRPQTVPQATGRPATVPPAGTGAAYEAQPEKKGGIPIWGWAIGCIGLLCIGSVVALGGFGLLGSLRSSTTPTPELVVEATATTADIETPTATAVSVVPETPTTNPSPTPTPLGPNGPGTAGTLVYGSSATGSITQGEREEWSFMAATGDRVDIVVDPAGDFDVVIDVLNDNDQSVLSSGEIDVSTGQEEIRNFIIPASGQYFISVRGFQDSSGTYEVSLSLSAAPEPGSTLLAQDTLSAGTEHLFPFNSSRGNVTVVAVVQSVGDFDAVLGIYDDNTDTLLQEVDESFIQETLSFTLPSSGNYYFKVTGFANSSGTYNITLTVPPEVTLLLVNQDEVTGSFDNTSQLDYYFRGNSGEIFTVSVIPDAAIDLVIEIYDADDLFTILAVIDDNLSGENEELIFTLPADGLYVIRIREYFGRSGAFFLTIE